MAKRNTNNPKVVNRGYVEEHICLDIRKLVADGCISKGQLTAFTVPGLASLDCFADLLEPTQAFVRVKSSGQKIPINWQSNRANRERLFFVDDTGRKTEKLYLVHGKFVSRQTGKLTFRSQSYGKEGRIRALQEPHPEKTGRRRNQE